MKNSKQSAYSISGIKIGEFGTREEVFHSGLTKREYFAGLAMRGMLASPNNISKYLYGSAGYSNTLVKESCRIADELLKQLDL